MHVQGMSTRKSRIGGFRQQRLDEFWRPTRRMDGDPIGASERERAFGETRLDSGWPVPPLNAEAVAVGIGVDEVFVDVMWPSGIRRIDECMNPRRVMFPSDKPSKFCECDVGCHFGWCANSLLGFFCSRNCCVFGGHCDNSLVHPVALKLVRGVVSSEFAVIAESFIGEGVVIGEYVGELVPSPMIPANPAGFLLQMKECSRGFKKSRIYIDASRCGNIFRFLNHSCNSAAVFHEARNGTRRAILIVTRRVVEPGDELTVDYGPNLWFSCKCGEKNCCNVKN